jgi:hypothetical protein
VVPHAGMGLGVHAAHPAEPDHSHADPPCAPPLSCAVVHVGLPWSHRTGA